jgi:hypothetical protein
MRIIALFSLLFGFMAQLIVAGQPYFSAVFGIVCCVIAIGCGVGAARLDPPHRWEGRILAGLGLALGVWCIVLLPSAYRYEEKIKARRKQRQKMEEQSGPTNKALQATAAAPGS